MGALTSAAPKQTVGVVIRTLNESELVGRCLDMLKRQRGDHHLDILIVDSGSTDATLQIARSNGVRTLEVAPEDFDYSRTLNLGIDEVRGEIVLVLSAHAIPVDETWVTTMIAPFADPRVAGVASKQVPWPDAPFGEMHRVTATFDDVARTYAGSDHGAILFSNAASAIRRSVWEGEPFMLSAAEDVEWAQRVVAAGWKAVYEPRASVYHSHDESARALARRMIDLNRGGTLAAHRRTKLRTAREALSYLSRDLRSIRGLDGPTRHKLAYASYVTRMVLFYAIDFSEAGSTAERRRKHARGERGCTADGR